MLFGPVEPGTRGSVEIGRFSPALAGARYRAGSLWILRRSAAAAGPRKLTASWADAGADPRWAAVKS